MLSSICRSDVRLDCMLIRLYGGLIVIHSTENEMLTLDQEWDKVKNQTLWTLEHYNCYIPSNTTQSVNPNPPPSQAERSQIQSPSESIIVTVPSTPGDSGDDEVPSALRDDGVATTTPEPIEATSEHAPASQPTDSHPIRNPAKSLYPSPKCE